MFATIRLSAIFSVLYITTRLHYLLYRIFFLGYLYPVSVLCCVLRQTTPSICCLPDYFRAGNSNMFCHRSDWPPLIRTYSRRLSSGRNSTYSQWGLIRIGIIQAASRCLDPDRANLGSTLAYHCRRLCDCPRPRPRKRRRSRLVDLAAVVRKAPSPRRLGHGGEGSPQSDNYLEFDFDRYRFNSGTKRTSVCRGCCLCHNLDMLSPWGHAPSESSTFSWNVSGNALRDRVR